MSTVPPFCIPQVHSADTREHATSSGPISSSGLAKSNALGCGVCEYATLPSPAAWRRAQDRDPPSECGYSAVMQDRADRAIAHVTSMAAGEPVEPSLPVTLHLHPDRLVAGVPILERMAHDGVYRSQFETGTSNGGLTAHPGGDRWRWESRIFAGAYDEASATDRPKYGALNFRRRHVGGSPRFGSAHLRLGTHVVARTTFCYPDSVFEPQHFGVASRLSTLIAVAAADDKDPLDDYIEAHVHGVVDLERDIEALVLDPCYRDTPTETAARRLPCPVEWHCGFRLTTTELGRHPDYRGPEFVRLGMSLARDGLLDPRIIGDAARSGDYDEQALKRVWHYVARFGSTEMADSGPTDTPEQSG